TRSCCRDPSSPSASAPRPTSPRWPAWKGGPTRATRPGRSVPPRTVSPRHPDSFPLRRPVRTLARDLDRLAALEPVARLHRVVDRRRVSAPDVGGARVEGVRVLAGLRTHDGEARLADGGAVLVGELAEAARGDDRLVELLVRDRGARQPPHRVRE